MRGGPVDDQVEMVAPAGHHQVVDVPALVVQQQRIAQPPALQQRQVGREHRLQRRVEVRPMELHLAHMADVEKASRRPRSEEHTYELQSLMRLPYAVSCCTKNHTHPNTSPPPPQYT